jgi:hypothetical protein
MHPKFNFIYLLITVCFVYACASVGTPEGGPRDEKAPLLVESFPKNQALKVAGNTIVLEFDEEIRLKDLDRQLIITPQTNNTFKSRVDKNTLKLQFEKPFQPNTTYFINFREAVEDVTEGNKAPNLAFAFSTGSYIDSGQVNGTVRDLYTNAVEKKINVVLYAAKDTTTIRKDKPYYFTQTDEKGNYKLQNVKEGEYRMYAHLDKNNNMIYDNDNEKIAYLGAPVKVTSATKPEDLLTLRLDTRKPLIEGSDKFADEYRIRYNEGLTAFNITNLGAGNTPAPFINLPDKRGSMITLFPTNPPAKNKFLATATDSAGNIRTDTLTISFEGKKATRNPEAFQLKMPGGQLTKETPLELRFEVPIKIAQPQEALTLVADSVNRKALSYPQDFKLNQNATILTILIPHKAQRSLQILMDTTKIVPVSGERFRKQNRKFPITNKILVGSLLGRVTSGGYKKYWVEIINRNGEIVETLDSPKELKLDKLEPDTYTIRVKIDEDNDGKWRAGNKDLVTPPEKIYHLPTPLEIRANWELEQALSI